MEKDKLEKAAFDFWDKNDYGHLIKTQSIDAFKAGAKWLMRQPMVERLSKEERKNIRKLNSIIESMFDMLPEGHVNQRRVIQVEDMLIKIFGKEMFEPKNNKI